MVQRSGAGKAGQAHKNGSVGRALGADHATFRAASPTRLLFARMSMTDATFPMRPLFIVQSPKKAVGLRATLMCIHHVVEKRLEIVGDVCGRQRLNDVGVHVGKLCAAVAY